MAANEWPLEPGFRYDGDQTDPVELRLIGKIPEYIHGTLYRTGNAGRTVEFDEPGNGKTKYNVDHWFDSFGLIHRFEILQDGTGNAKVMYNSRRTCDDLVKQIRETGARKGMSFGQKRDPCETIFRRFKNTFQARQPLGKSNENVCVAISPNFPALPDELRPKDTIPGKPENLVIRTDSVLLQSLDPITLEPIGYTSHNKIGPNLGGPLAAAHMQTCPKTGDIFNFNLQFSAKCTYKVWRHSKSTGKTDVLATICEPDAPPAYLHSFWMSENYIVLCVWNSMLGYSGLKVLMERNILDAIEPFEKRGNPTFYVIDRTPAMRGVIAKFQTSEKFFAFHTINCWEEPSANDPKDVDLVCEVCAYRNSDILQRLRFEFLLAPINPELPRVASSIHRWRLSSVTSRNPKEVAEAILERDACFEYGPELPIINPTKSRKAHRFMWAPVQLPGTIFFSGLGKFDSEDLDEPKIWENKGHVPAEAIFIANPDKEGEDEGVLLSVVCNLYDEKSFLLILDAKEMTEVARAEFNKPISFGFHGRFFDER